MKLKKLQLENFRSYEAFSYEFSEESDLTVLVGKNGKGKTNFLEAIYALSLGRSFRSMHHEDLIEWEKDYMRINGEVEIDEEQTNLELFYGTKPIKKKNLKRNDVSLKSSEYVGTLLTVLFHPEDLNMLYLSPSYRRRYMDILLSQTDKKCLLALTNYKKVLKQRNALLYEIRKTNKIQADLSAWNEELITFGSEIIKKREGLVKFLNKNLSEIYRSISGGKEEVKIIYKNSVKVEDYLEKLERKQEIDIYRGKTTIGPHRDDLTFFISGKEINKSASRGEFRTLLLAIKLGEITYIEEKTNKKPILLLDDVFSELDPKRQNHLLKSINGRQTIITTTDIANLGELAKESRNMRVVKM